MNNQGFGLIELLTIQRRTRIQFFGVIALAEVTGFRLLQGSKYWTKLQYALSVGLLLGISGLVLLWALTVARRIMRQDARDARL